MHPTKLSRDEDPSFQSDYKTISIKNSKLKNWLLDESDMVTMNLENTPSKGKEELADALMYKCLIRHRNQFINLSKLEQAQPRQKETKRSKNKIPKPKHKNTSKKKVRSPSPLNHPLTFNIA